LHLPACDLEVMGRKASARVAAVLDNRVLLEQFTGLYDDLVRSKGPLPGGRE
jgi:hypothetical protein